MAFRFQGIYSRAFCFFLSSNFPAVNVSGINSELSCYFYGALIAGNKLVHGFFALLVRKRSSLSSHRLTPPHSWGFLVSRSISDSKSFQLQLFARSPMLTDAFAWENIYQP